MMPDQFVTITVTRKSQLMDGHSPMQIIINGYRAGSLKNGETSSYQVPGNQARLQAFLAMSKSQTLEVTAGDSAQKNFLVQSTMTNLLFITGVILVLCSTALVLYTEQVLYMLIAMPPALYHLYLRFARKDKYLVIKEL